MYTKTGGAALALTPGVTFWQLGSITAAGIALLLVGSVFLIATRRRVRHDNNAIS